jgi:hypothetical protein
VGALRVARVALAATFASIESTAGTAPPSADYIKATEQFALTAAGSAITTGTAQLTCVILPSFSTVLARAEVTVCVGAETSTAAKISTCWTTTLFVVP